MLATEHFNLPSISPLHRVRKQQAANGTPSVESMLVQVGFHKQTAPRLQHCADRADGGIFLLSPESARSGPLFAGLESAYNSPDTALRLSDAWCPWTRTDRPTNPIRYLLPEACSRKTWAATFTLTPS